MALGQSRVKSTDPRARRNAARLANRAEQIASGVLGVDDQGRIVLNLSTDPGLENSDGLRVKVASPIERTASGIGLNLATDPGLEDVSGLRVDAVAPLARTSEGLGLSLPDLSVLQVVGEDLTLAYDTTRGLASVTSTPDMVQYANLVAWWKLDDGAGTTAVEEQSGNDGTLEGSFTGGDGSGWSSDFPAASPFVSGSLDMDGDDIAVALGGPPVPAEYDIDPDGDDYSICFWVKNPGGSGYIISWAGDDGGGLDRGFWIENSFDEFNTTIGAGYNSTDTDAADLDPLDGEWHHIAVTVENVATTAVKIYMDATLISDGDNNTGTHEGPWDWLIGARRDTTDSTVRGEWDGLICDLRFYHTVLTASEIGDIVAGNEAPGSPNLAVDIASTSPGLEFDGSGDLQVKIKADSGLTVDADGLQVTPAAAQTDSSQDALALSSVTDPADAPADADALRDDLVANALAELQTRDGELETAVETLAGEFNSLLAKLRAADLLTS